LSLSESVGVRVTQLEKTGHVVKLLMGPVVVRLAEMANKRERECETPHLA
jgi:hypothetical protein